MGAIVFRVVWLVKESGDWRKKIFNNNNEFDIIYSNFMRCRVLIGWV
jgi:hypothetical protein